MSYNNHANKETFDVIALVTNNYAYWQRVVEEREAKGPFTADSARRYVESFLGKQPKSIDWASVAANMNE